jgi:hypothetical protein
MRTATKRPITMSQPTKRIPRRAFEAMAESRFQEDDTMSDDRIQMTEFRNNHGKPRTGSPVGVSEI